MSDNRPRSFCDGVYNRLREAFSWRLKINGATTCVTVSPKGNHFSRALEKLLFGLLPPPERSRICETTVVLVQEFCDEIHVPLFERLNEREHEVHLGGIGSF